LMKCGTTVLYEWLAALYKRAFDGLVWPGEPAGRWAARGVSGAD
jgi:hypothetical protein